MGEFLDSQRSEMQSVTQEQVDQLASSIIKSLIDPPINAGQEADAFWGHIIDDTPFDWIEQVIGELKALTSEDVKQAADRWIFNESHRASVSVMLFGKEHLTELSALKSMSEAEVPARGHNGEVSSGSGTSTPFFPKVSDHSIVDGSFSTASGAHLCVTLEGLTAVRNSLHYYSRKVNE